MVPFASLVRWSTLNGAEFLGVANRFGKIKTRNESRVSKFAGTESR
jgi:hypothetical protein